MPNPFIDISLNIPKPRFNTLSQLIRLTFHIFFKGFWFITKVALILLIPFDLINVFFSATNTHPLLDHFVSFVSIFFRVLTYPVIIYGISHYLKHKTFPSFGEAYNFGFHKWSLVFGRGLKAELIAFFGLLLLIIPGVLAYIAYAFVPYTVCFESRTQKDSIRRSRELSIGNRKLILFSSCILILLILIPIIGTALLFLPVFMIPWLHFLKPLMGAGMACTFEIFLQSLLISNLLIYLKAVKERKKKPKEIWLLRWAK
jgi:hypothetical protein